MNDKTFKNQMSLRERIGGIVYIPIHCFVLPLIASIVCTWIYLKRGIEISELLLNLIIYAFGALFCFLFMWKFLKVSFGTIFDAPLGFIKTAVAGFFEYYFASIIITALLLMILPENSSIMNPNTESVGELIYDNYNMSVIMTVIFAPIVEECMFRGAVFGTIRTKNRFWAYFVTVILFSAYHLLGYFITDYSWELWVYLLQYVPATIVLCRAYEKSGTIWCPILIHAVINLMATYITSTP